jgi:hypothetical protein
MLSLVNANPAKVTIKVKLLGWNQEFVIPPWLNKYSAIEG